MNQPLHRFKADLFKVLGNPLRIRIVELLRVRDMTVAELLQQLEVEATTASQQLAVLRAHGLVDGQREGANVRYALRDPLAGELLDVARRMFDNRVVDLQQLQMAQEREERVSSRPSGERGRAVGAPS